MKVFRRLMSFVTLRSKVIGLAVIVPALAFTLFFIPNAHAAGETYGYAASGAKIIGQGGSFGSATATFTKQPIQSQGNNQYTASVKVKGNNGNCMLGLLIVAAPGSTSGAISAPGYLNGLSGSGAPGTASTPSCSKSYAAGLSEFNRSISVSTAGNNNPGPTPGETAGQREIVATIYSDKKATNLPTIKVSETKVGSAGTATNVISWNTTTNIGSTRWSNIDPGSYKICVTPDNLFSYFSACQTVTKVAGTALLVNFGSSANNLNDTGKLVSVTVNLSIPGGTGVQTYGPIDLTLFNSTTKAPAGPTGETEAESVGTESGTRNDGQVLHLSAKVDDVDPGSYIVCVTGHSDLCSAVFTKPVNIQTSTVINIPEAKSKEFLSTDGKSTCSVEGVGWIVCPILTFMGGIVDGAYNFVSGLLKVQPLVTTGQNQGIYQAWAVMRNIANVAFVIAFLIIIFSQLTGVGVSNYGVKKLLPRLVIAAILVNLSFWVCAIAIDLSNVIGASMVQIFDSIGTNISTNLNGTINDGANLLNGGQWTDIIGAVIAGAAVGGAVYYVGLAALIPALLAAIVAIVTVFLVLTLRQALIILLVVIAPLAFVAYLLPNTEDLFTKWRKLLTTLLLMYPIIAGIFGASALASMIVMRSAPNNTVVQIMGACIAILPLALTPIVMKTAGGVLNRFAGIVNNVNKGPIDRLRKVGASYQADRKNLRDTRALNGAGQGGRGTFVRWRARRNAISGGVKSEQGRAEQRYIADAMTKEGTDTPSAFANKVAGGTTAFGKPIIVADPAALQRALAGAKFTIEKAEIDDIKAEQSLISNLDMTALQTKLAKADTSTAGQAAIIDRMIKIGMPENYQDAVDQIGKDNDPKHSVLRQSVANSLRENGPQFLKASDFDAIATGGLATRDKQGNIVKDKDGNDIVRTLSSIAKDNIAKGVYSQEKLVSEPAVNLKFAFEQADEAGKKRMSDTAKELIDNPTLRGKIKHNVEVIEKMSKQEDPGPNPK